MIAKKTNRDLAQMILSRRYVPLEDKIFFEMLVIFSIILAVMSYPLAMSQKEAVAENINAIAAHIAAAIPDETIRHLPVLELSATGSSQFQDANLPSLSLVKADVAKGLCKSSDPCVVKHGMVNLLLFNSAKLTSGVLLAVNSNSIPTPRLSRVSNSPFVSSLIGAVVISLVLRLVLRKQIFGNLDTVTKVIFARRIFAATGGTAQDSAGRELDGRFHFFISGFNRAARATRILFRRFGIGTSQEESENSSNQRTNEIRIVRRPDYPRIPLEQFTNDELGQLALALEEDHARELRREHLVADLLEAFPAPAAAISKDARNIHVNRKMQELLGQSRTAITSDIVSLNDILEVDLNFPEDLAKRVIKVLDQTAPRVNGKEYTFKTNTGQRVFPVSVSSVNKMGKRVAIVVIQEQAPIQSQQLGEILSDLAGEQLDMVQSIINDAAKLPLHDISSIIVKCDKLKDQINTFFDFINNDIDDSIADQIDFNLHSLLHSLQENGIGSHRMKVFISNDVPSHIYANPSHLRQYLFLISREFFTHNAREGTLAVEFNKDTEEVTVSCRSEGMVKKIGNPMRTSLFAQLARSYHYAISSTTDTDPETFFSFSFRVHLSSSGPNFVYIESPEQLREKNILVVHPDEVLDSATTSLFKQINAKKVEFISMRIFREQTRLEHIYDAAIVFTNSPNWQKDPDLAQAATALKKNGIPSLLVPSTPRRGDSSEAQAAGFSGYLRRPFTIKEMEGLLLLLDNREVRGSLIGRGILTRHVVHELSQEAGKALIAEFEPEDEKAANDLAASLARLSIKVIRTTNRSEFFEEVLRQSYTYILYPSKLSPGLRRQMTMNLQSKNAICYSVDDGILDLEDSPILPSHRGIILNPSNVEEVLMTIRASVRPQGAQDTQIETPKKTA